MCLFKEIWCKYVYKNSFEFILSHTFFPFVPYILTNSYNSWSFGVLLYEIVTMGATPYPGMKKPQLYTFIKGKNVMLKPDECPTSLYEIMKQCWQFAASARPNFGQVIEMLEQALFAKQV